MRSELRGGATVDLPVAQWGDELGANEEFIEIIIIKGKEVELWRDGICTFGGGMGEELWDALAEAKSWMEGIGQKPHLIISASQSLAFEEVKSLHRLAAQGGIVAVSYAVRITGGNEPVSLVQLRGAWMNESGLEAPKVNLKNDGTVVVSNLEEQPFTVKDLEGEYLMQTLARIRTAVTRDEKMERRVFLGVESEIPAQTFVRISSRLGSDRLNVILDPESYLYSE